MWLVVCVDACHAWCFFLNLRTEDRIQKRARTAGKISALLSILLFIGAGIWLHYGIDGYSVTGALAHDGPSNPHYKTAIRLADAWFFNYRDLPITLFAPGIGIIAALLAFIAAKHVKTAFICSALSVAGIIATVGVSMFPFILPSSSNPGQSLLVWDSSSSQLTLFNMLVGTVILLPLILLYTAWVYHVLRGKITEQTITKNQDTAY